MSFKIQPSDVEELDEFFTRQNGDMGKEEHEGAPSVEKVMKGIMSLGMGFQALNLTSAEGTFAMAAFMGTIIHSVQDRDELIRIVQKIMSEQVDDLDAIEANEKGEMKWN